MYARTENGIVTETLRVPPENIYPPSYASQFVTAPAGVARGWLYDGINFTAPAGPSLADQRAAKWVAIKELRDRKIQEGGYTTAAKWYHSDTFSRTQQMGLYMMGAAVPPIQWKTMDGSFVTITQAIAAAIFNTAVASDNATFTRAEVLRAIVNASDTPDAVDITTGWPATFAP